MLADERQRLIVETVGRDGSARVRDLARALDVTEETIRRDLEKLEAERLVVRRHGGAIAVKSGSDISFAQRDVIHPEEKRAIAAHALRYIAPGDTIFLDASTTSLHIARMLPNEDYVVVSFAIHVLTELISRDRIRVVAIGGTLDRPSHSFVGPTAERAIAQFHAAKGFYSCTAFHADRGATDASEFHAVLKKAMMLNARENYLLADHSKYGQTALSTFARLSDFTRLVTDSKVTAEAVSRIEEAGLPVDLAGPGN